MDIHLSCDVCAKRVEIEDIEFQEAQILIGQWIAHDHTKEEINAWKEMETELSKFKHTTPFTGGYDSE